MHRLSHFSFFLFCFFLSFLFLSFLFLSFFCSFCFFLSLTTWKRLVTAFRTEIQRNRRTWLALNNSVVIEDVGRKTECLDHRTNWDTIFICHPIREEFRRRRASSWWAAPLRSWQLYRQLKGRRDWIWTESAGQSLNSVSFSMSPVSLGAKYVGWWCGHTLADSEGSRREGSRNQRSVLSNWHHSLISGALPMPPVVGLLRSFPPYYLTPLAKFRHMKNLTITVKNWLAVRNQSRC